MTIIDRQPDKPSIVTNISWFTKRFIRKCIGKYKGPLIYKGYFPPAIMKEQQSFVDGFRKDILTVYSTNELRSCINWDLYDAVIVGSDQTWRPRYVPNVMDYWLGFLKANKRV